MLRSRSPCTPHPQALKMEESGKNEQIPHFEVEETAAATPSSLRVKEEAAARGRAERGGRCGDFICEERGNVPELFDLIVWREAGVDIQPCWNQTKIINTSRHQQLLADPAHRGPGCWLIPKGKNELWFPSSPRTRWEIGAERTADGSGHKAGGRICLRGRMRAGGARATGHARSRAQREQPFLA